MLRNEGFYTFRHKIQLPYSGGVNLGIIVVLRFEVFLVGWSILNYSRNSRAMKMKTGKQFPSGPES